MISLDTLGPSDPQVHTINITVHGSRAVFHSMNGEGGLVGRFAPFSLGACSSGNSGLYTGGRGVHQTCN